MPPANTAKILTKGCSLFVFPYTLGLIIYPSILGQIKHTINVKINNLVLITEEITRAKIFTTKPPNYGIIVVTEARIPNIK